VTFAEQRFQRGPDAATIDAAEIAAEDRLVDLARPPRVPRQQLAVEFSRLAVTTSVAASVTDSMTVRVFMIESISASSGLHSSFARLVDFAATRCISLRESTGRRCCQVIGAEHGFSQNCP